LNLLEIFQGAVPSDGSIIIANTNDYDGIRELCPALFRPGRLTPVYFGYLDKPTIQQLSEYYFKKSLDIVIPQEIKVPTSQIIELALSASTKDKNIQFEFFQSSLQDLFNKQ
jgi:hypothetical protein